MAVKDDSTLITKGDLKKFYNKILPYMGGNYVFNTLGTKDYYSEDEKVIGVWTDGRPVYRKVYNITTPSSPNTNTVLFNIGSEIEVKNMYGHIISPGGGVRPVPWNYSGAAIIIFVDPGVFYMNVNDNINIKGRPGQIVLEYTKTTDTINSAVDTIGCYDITRPDLWPVEKEITFGNGLYGQRFTGTYSLSANQWKSINLSTLIPSSIIDYGGIIQQSTWFNTLPLCYIGNDGALQSEATIWYDPSNNTGLILSIYFSTAQSNSKYDIWVTYKKK